jgi:AraC-like DNA-binding protein
MDDIDVQWIVRYLIMVVLSGVVFYWLCISNQPTRAFTQQWYLAFVLAYTTERILYRPDPQKRLKENNPAGAGLTTESAPTGTKSAVLKLEQWLEKEKPYLNPDFQLADLRQVLPLNRTYLSQLINSEYGCSFYQWVNSLRVKEAMRLLSENPDMKIQDIAERCGFSSRRVFTQIFTRETGTTPSEWVTAQNNSK